MKAHDAEFATITRRAVALLLDGIIIGLGIFAVGFSGIQLMGQDAAPVQMMLGLTGFFYYVILEGVWGQTLGKKMTGITVVNRDGIPPGVFPAVARNLLRVADGLFVYLVGAVIIWQSEHNQRLGDIVARTYVLRT